MQIKFSSWGIITPKNPGANTTWEERAKGIKNDRSFFRYIADFFSEREWGNYLLARMALKANPSLKTMVFVDFIDNLDLLEGSLELTKRSLVSALKRTNELERENSVKIAKN